MSLNEFIFVLGAQDPEMDMIEERIIVPLALNSEYATINSTRVDPSNAYQVENKIDESSDKKIVLIECGGEHLSGIKIDHHRPGDPGYGVKAEDFFNASSLGQMVKFVLSKASSNQRLFFELAKKINGEKLSSRTEGNALLYNGTRWIFPNSTAMDIALPSEFIYQAAADHCLAAGYAGKCPGVDKEGLRVLQARNMSKTTGASLDEVFASIKKAEALFTTERERVLGNSSHLVFDLTDLKFGVGYSLGYLSLKEAGTMLGKPYLVSHRFAESSPPNVMLNAASEEQVDYFLTTFASKYGLTKVFGSPSRGYAGGVLPSD
jgi:hypothetical protein